VWIGIELSSNDSGKIFIRLPSGAGSDIEVSCPQLHLVDPVVDLGSRERLDPIVIPESGEDLNPLHAFVSEELDDAPLFEFHHFGAFRPLTFSRLTLPPTGVSAVPIHRDK
jgi:hypothetical protein